MGYDVNNPAPLNEGEGILAPLQQELSEDHLSDLQTFNEMKQVTSLTRNGRSTRCCSLMLHHLRALQMNLKISYPLRYSLKLLWPKKNKGVNAPKQEQDDINLPCNRLTFGLHHSSRMTRRISRKLGSSGAKASTSNTSSWGTGPWPASTSNPS